MPEYYPHSGAGISTYYLQYIKALRPYAESIKVIVGSGYVHSEDKYLVNNVEIEYLNPDIYNNYLKKFEKFNFIPVYKKNIAAAWAMWQQSMQGDGYDIIECCDFGMGYIPWLVNHNKPVIVRLHGSEGQIELKEPNLHQTVFGDANRQTELLLLAKADRLITHSKTNALFWELALVNKKVEYIPPVFETDVLPIPFSKKDDFGIVCARIQQWKGPDILCNGLKTESKIINNIKWFGRDTALTSNQSKSAQLAQDYPEIWGRQIHPLPPLSNKLIKAEQIKAKFAVVPSTWDMFNFTVLENMAAGTPVVCSEETGASDLIINGINGFKFSVNNVAQLSDRLWSVNNLTEPEYELMVKKGLETIRMLASEKIIPNNLNIYQEIIQNFIYSKSNFYLETIYKPTNTVKDFNKILDGQSLKNLTQYLFKRILKKYFTSKRF